MLVIIQSIYKSQSTRIDHNLSPPFFFSWITGQFLFGSSLIKIFGLKKKTSWEWDFFLLKLRLRLHLILFFFFFTRFGGMWLLFIDFSTMNSVFVYCLWIYKFHFSAIFSLKMGLMILFTHLKIICYNVFSFSFSFQFR